MKLIRKQWFLVVLLLALATGYFFSHALKPLADAGWLKWTVVAATMFVMAWPLEIGRLYHAFSRPMAPLLATAINFILIPLLAWPISYPLGIELGPGLIVAAAVPSTLASGAVWTRRAGGDDSVAIAVTLLTNSMCFLVTPLIIYLLLGNVVETEVFFAAIYKLLFFVVCPMAVAQVLRIQRQSATWATAHKAQLSTAAMFGVLFMVLTGSVSAGLKVEQSGAGDLQVGQITMMLIAVAVIHLAGFFSGLFLARQLKLPLEQQIAVGFSGSQKTLMAGLSTALSMGLNIIPMVAYHAMQLILDTVIADRIKRANKK